MNEKEQKELILELNGKSHEELVNIIIELKKDMNLTRSVYNSFMKENEALKNGITAIRSVLELLNNN